MLNKGVLKKLYYDKRLSMWDTAEKLSVSPATVLYWMKRYKFNRRPASECAYAKQNPNGDPFKIKQKLTLKEKELLSSALMLYWAEGSRRNKHVIQIANLDGRLLRLFAMFLRRICGVKKEKLCVSVQLYNGYDRDNAKNYWSRTLEIPKKYIAVNAHTDTRSKPDEQWSKNGIARIEVRNVKLKQWIDERLENYIKIWN